MQQSPSDHAIRRPAERHNTGSFQRKRGFAELTRRRASHGWEMPVVVCQPGKKMARKKLPLWRFIP
jgi:hypothetical protein